MRKKRVVITGLGVIAPNGIGKDEFWVATIQGKSCVHKLTRFNEFGFKSMIASEVKGFEARLFGLTEDQIDKLDRYAQFAIAGAKMAIADSKIKFDKEKFRAGVSIANAICGTKRMEEEFVTITNKGKEYIKPEYASPSLYDNSTFNTASKKVADLFGAKGPCCTLSTGCTAGTDSIGYAYEAIANDESNVMIAGASEAPITPIAIAAFDAIGALSKRNDNPEKASRPFDLERDGFVLGEGCGILILEELNHAMRRNAFIYGEVIGYGTTNNAKHMTDLSPDGEDLARSIVLAIEDAGISPDDVNYINAHGSSTPQNDICETNAIKRAFGKAAYKIPISSIKSMIGHALAAANSIEVIACVLVIRDNIMPPTINYALPDPECDLDYIPNQMRRAKVDTILKTSSGFSGIHSSLVLRRFYGN